MAHGRDRAWRRKTDYAKAIRKKTITAEVYPTAPGFEWYDNLHQYSKNKIHCSCPLCRSKTRHPGGCGPAENWSARDIRQQEDEKYQLNDKEEA